ncbi:hypothetical protein BDZ91DRAFT_708507 [Kalaharituber pfeilii]|nr:hypothetical protein BDZ91DRAFT_708507 [Kalaharituber pfeilii]
MSRLLVGLPPAHRVYQSCIISGYNYRHNGSYSLARLTPRQHRRLNYQKVDVKEDVSGTLKPTTTRIGSSTLNANLKKAVGDFDTHLDAMTRLTPESVQAIRRLCAHVPPKSNYELMPLSRRAAVLLLLFPDVQGRLKVVLTLRSELLRNFAGQVALPGGKADSLTETPQETARREAYEEIGLPLPTHNFVLSVPVTPSQSADPLKKKHYRFQITHLAELPCSLSKTNIAVRPCVALLLPTGVGVADGGGPVVGPTAEGIPNLDVDFDMDIESLLIPRLDPKEVAAVFSVPLEAFLSKDYNPFQDATSKSATTPSQSPPTKWYSGKLHNWYGRDWYMHEFMAPVWAHHAAMAGGDNTSKAAARAGYNDKLLQPEEAALLVKNRKGDDKWQIQVKYYRVWGMTAKILIDAARIAYARQPEFECLEGYGDEDMIFALYEHGMLRTERKHGEEYAVVEMFTKGNL